MKTQCPKISQNIPFRGLTGVGADIPKNVTKSPSLSYRERGLWDIGIFRAPFTLRFGTIFGTLLETR